MKEKYKTELARLLDLSTPTHPAAKEIHLSSSFFSVIHPSG
jgi:hypothetical protein